MRYLTEIRQLVNQDGEVEQLTHRKIKKRYYGERFSVAFWDAIHNLVLADPSRTAYRLFLLLLADGLSGNALVVDTKGIATRLGLTQSLISRGLRELVSFNVLICGKYAGQNTYRFNPRIIWHGSVDDRPETMEHYPKIGRNKTTEKTK